jgi:preprotein translocase subunit SecA
VTAHHPAALTEQRERALDLIDRILGAMIEESCPANKPPEDWDWGGIFQGFKEHFGLELPDEVSQIHDRREPGARAVRARREGLH